MDNFNFDEFLNDASEVEKLSDPIIEEVEIQSDVENHEEIGLKVKPFEKDELLARIEAMIRRNNRDYLKDEILEVFDRNLPVLPELALRFEQLQPQHRAETHL